MTNEIRDSETDPFVRYCYSPHDLFEFSFLEEYDYHAMHND